MKEAHYVSLEIAKGLAEAGIDFPESEAIWQRWKYLNSQIKWSLFRRCNTDYRFDPPPNVTTVEFLPAPSLMEIMDRLPRLTHVWNEENEYHCYRRLQTGGYIETTANTAPDAPAGMLIKRKERDEKDFKS